MIKKVEVIGLGAGDLDQLPLGVYRRLINTRQTVFVRTMDHPVIKDLEKEGVIFHSFDHIYEASEQFEDVYDAIVKEIITSNAEEVTYAVPGHPMLAEKTVQLLLAAPECDVTIAGGQSYLDDLFTSLKIDPIDGFQFLDATDFARENIMYGQHLIFSQVYDAFIASEVKLVLLEDLPETYEVVIVEAAGTSQEKLRKVTLEDLDRVMEMNNLTSVYVPPVPDDLLQHRFQQLRHVIQTLRGPGGCPWDQKQTHESLRPYLVEEAYELLDAIDVEDDEHIVEELGDVLLQVMLHSQIGEDDGYFSIDDVIKRLTYKMIHRHPHVFGGGDPAKSWETLKREENGAPTADYLLDDSLLAAPALQSAYQLQKRVARVGFSWENVEDVWAKLAEERNEFIEAVKTGTKADQEEEFGDMLFVMANLASQYGVQPELALYQANQKFKRRFTEVEKKMREDGRTFSEVSLVDMDAWWDIAKEGER